jgi:hypothetical protein
MQVADGASEHASGGYFDVFDTPPWDTWVWYVDDTPTLDHPNDQTEGVRRVDFLIAWVPPVMIAWVEHGIAVNPMECLGWLPAKRLQTTLIEELLASGLLAG